MKKFIATIASGALIFSMVTGSMAFAQDKEAVEDVKTTTAAEETASSEATAAAVMGAGALAVTAAVVGAGVIALTLSESGDGGHGHVGAE